MTTSTGTHRDQQKNDRAELATARQHHLAGSLTEAEGRYRALLARDQNDGAILELLGALLCQTGRNAEACEVLSRVAVNGANAGVLVNLSTAYRALGQAAPAADAARKAIALRPDIAAAHFNLGHALRDLGDALAAGSAYTRYLELCPTDADGYSILGDTYLAGGLNDEAILAYEGALTRDPAHFNAHANIAHILRNRGWFHAALAIMEALERVRPDDPDAHKAYGAALLQLGNFAEGWPRLESRFECSSERVIRRAVPPRFWAGETLSGKSVLIWTEQGLGDEILHGSIIPDVIKQARRCVIECSPRILPVFKRSFPQAQVLSYEQGNIPVSRPEDFDVQVALASLGAYLRRDFASFPAHGGYLKADAGRTKQLRNAYLERANGRKIVGLAWRSTANTIGPHKSAALQNLSALLQTPGVMFVNLQYGDCRAEIAQARAAFGIDIFEDPSVDPIADFDAFFAQVAAMDLVITTSNTTVHVAGSQGVPVWVLLPFANGLLWYWFLDREDSPWYPSARLIRAVKRESTGQAWELEPATRCAVDLARFAQA